MSQQNPESSKDEEVITVLNTVLQRPVFVNLHYSIHEIATLDHVLLIPEGEDTQIEVVGSSKDGLKVGRAFDVGDIDALFYSNTLSFDSADELTFEYNADDPCFFTVPQPQKLSKLKAVDKIYLNANFLRIRHPDLFTSKVKDNYRYVPFTIVPFSSSMDSTKCALTAAVPYSDPVFKEDKKASDMSVEHPVLVTWSTEHTLLTHLLQSRNKEKLDFVKELLYGCDVTKTKTTASQLKKHVIMWKQDFQRNMFTVYDMLYFKSKEFNEILEQAVDPEILPKLTQASKTDPHGEYSVDLVPAIKCTGWPRPALSFQTRERKWPLESVVANIVKQGYQVVAKAPPINPQPDKDFILSFSPAEQQLANALPSQAKIAYCLLKLCFKCAKQQLPDEDNHSLKTFHLKTALFWVAEKTDPKAWDTNSILWGFRAICVFLIDCLKKQNLPSFFVPSNNLIRHLTSTDTKAVSTVLQLIHDNPANYVHLVIEKEWEFSRVTMPDDSFQMIQEPGYYDQFSWLELIKFYCYSFGRAGDYPLDSIMDNMSSLKSESFYEQFVPDPFRAPRFGNMPYVFDITDDQLKHVELFVQTVTQMEMDLFNVLDHEVEDDIMNAAEEWLSEDTLELYPKYDGEADAKFGEHFLAMIRLRLKYYGNIFHVICNKLIRSTWASEQTTQNHDALYIIKFLNMLKQKREFTEENIEDLLHYMLYFCHFTRLRHHNLHIDEQILRSMREFLQDAKHMMTIYFNPRETIPIPVDLGGKIETVLGECFPRVVQESQCIVG